MIRLLYSLAWWLALPLVLGRLWWRGRKEPGYREHMAERFGFYSIRPGRPVLWVHAVSVGETRAAEPLIDALLREYPDHSILLTHMTPTGRATGKSLFSKNGDRLMQCYLPYDTGFMVGRFLKQFQPRICILMETEVWPNLIAQCVKHHVPVALVNARLSERSLAKAQRLSALMSEAARGFSCVAAQTEADAERLRLFGARNVNVTGSIKFDVTPPEQMLEKGAELRRMMGTRPVLLCASTREGEEDLILDALTSASDMTGALVVIVPRHPQRFDEVEAKVAAHGLSSRRRSSLAAPMTDDVRILLGDSMGEMFAYYAACDVAFVGGSLLPLGGQNLIEACAVGKPVLIGPHTFNFSVISEEAVDAQAAMRIADADKLMRAARLMLYSLDDRMRMSANALAFARQHKGATVRTMALLKPLIHS